jgi:hypothetical protein
MFENIQFLVSPGIPVVVVVVIIVVVIVVVVVVIIVVVLGVGLHGVLAVIFLLCIFPFGSALIVGVFIVAVAAWAAGVAAAAHLQLKRRRQVDRLALKISCANLKKKFDCQKV